MKINIVSILSLLIASSLAMATTRYTVPIPEGIPVLETRQQLNDMADQYPMGTVDDRNGGYYLLDHDGTVLAVTSDSLSEELDASMEEARKLHAGNLDDEADIEFTQTKLENASDALYEAYATKGPEWHQQMTRRLLRKVDLHLLPFLVVMYLLNFLDRNNLSQARLGTLEKDLGMAGTDFNLATSILFVGYLLMQLPSNLLLTRVKPSWLLGGAMAIWGIISACQAAATSFKGLVLARFFLGFVEAPFFPGAIMLMSSWYTRQELGHRIAWFYAGSSLANAFGGLIGAGVLGNLDGVHGIAGWRWLFIIEGSITVGVSLFSTVFLPNYPATTSWLDETEQAYAQWRLINDAGEADDTNAVSIRDALAMVLRDRRIYLFILLQHSSLLSQTFQYFFPTIVKTLGYGSIETLLITAPVWIATFLVSLFVTWTSGRTNDRSWHIMGLMSDAHGRRVSVPNHHRLGSQFIPPSASQALGSHRDGQYDREHGDNLWQLYVAFIFWTAICSRGQCDGGGSGSGGSAGVGDSDGAFQDEQEAGGGEGT
ncbi:hypothetical protein CNMCM5623_008855 [Aspergillus felis]|uniref:Major facilitator superfamily (MFS) profile domain-containing protein n=1 Tax=Aspergillus felis TaxID=1287682 RepID=A0A8H6UV49_9EURO|nr:hypothetical protein CNMCM5623_008855 [Aspergillus felis]